MTRSSARARNLRHILRTAASKRKLRVESLEPRLVLSTSTPIAAAANAYVAESMATCNYGGSPNLLVENLSGSQVYDSYLKFNLGALNGQIISSATLKLVPTLVGGAAATAATAPVQVKLVSTAADGWTEGSGGINANISGPITWSNQPTSFSGQPVTPATGSKLVEMPLTNLATTSGSTAVTVTSTTGLLAGMIVTGPDISSGTTIASVTNATKFVLSKAATGTAKSGTGSASQTLSIDVTSLVLQQFSTNQCISFQVSETGVAGLTNWVDFGSRENGTIDYRPSLLVTTVPAATLTVIPVASVAAAGTTATLSMYIHFTNSGLVDNNSLSVLWTATSWPGWPNGATPTFDDPTKRVPTVTFSQIGTYSFWVQVVDTAGNAGANGLSVTVSPVTTSIVVNPGSITLPTGGATGYFTAAGVDQFNHQFSLTSGVTWSTSFGSFSPTGLYTAPSTAGSGKVTATVATPTGGKATATANVVVSGAAINLGIQDFALLAFIQNQLATSNNVLTRADMIAILNYVDGGTNVVAPSATATVSAVDLADLKTLIGAANSLKLSTPGYVQVLASDVINDSNQADTNYLGNSLANLKAGAAGSGTVLWDLTQKWFLGSDLPASNGSYNPPGFTTLPYASFAQYPLFDNLQGVPSIPLYTDTHQDQLGDCYFLASMASIALASPQAIENMIVPNGDGTYTVRFYTPSGTADYVTVNTMLPVYQGNLWYDLLPPNNNGIWLPLVEKAYAQWDETGNETMTKWTGLTGGGSNFSLVTRVSQFPGFYANSYATIEGGWSDDVYCQVLNTYGQAKSLTQPTQEFWYLPTAAQSQALDAQLIAVLTGANYANYAVEFGTLGFNPDPDPTTGIHSSHEYFVTSYTASNGTFQLFNPWNASQPKQNVVWSQLVALCDNFGYVDATQTGPISAVPQRVAAGNSGVSVTLSIAKRGAAEGANAFSEAAGDAAPGGDAARPVDSGANAGISPSVDYAGRVSQGAIHQFYAAPARAQLLAADWSVSDSVILHDGNQSSSGISGDAVDALFADGSIFQKSALV